MQRIKLLDPVYKELFIFSESEFARLQYTGTAMFNSKIRTAFLPGEGTRLCFENQHFLVLKDGQPTRKYKIWRNHNVVGECEITTEAAVRANKSDNAEFYFGR